MFGLGGKLNGGRGRERAPGDTCHQRLRWFPAAVTKPRRLGGGVGVGWGLTQQNSVDSPIWRPETREQGGDRPGALPQLAGGRSRVCTELVQHQRSGLCRTGDGFCCVPAVS